MKSLSKWLGAAVAGMAMATSLYAADDNNPWYFKAETGVNILPDTQFRSSSATANAKFDIGSRMGLTAGYSLSHCWSLELEAGYVFNQIDKVGADSGHSGDNVWQVPLIVNAVYNHAFNEKWSAYGSLGAGAGINTVDISHGGSDTSVAFDYQAGAGVKYAFNDRCSLGLGYKFLGTTDNDWTVGGKRLQTDPFLNQSILLNFTLKF